MAALATPGPHYYGHPSFPEYVPDKFEVSDFAEPVYDPNMHLDLKMPDYVVNLKFEKFFPASDLLADGNEEELEKLKEFLKPGLAFSAPFRVLSDEGLRVMREVIEHHKQNTPPVNMHSNRHPWYIRGLGYVSKFVRDFSECPVIAKKMSILAGKPMIHHGMPMNYSHVNVGMPSTGRKVDHWHVDSVAYSLVVLISDPKDMIGGELQVLTRDRDEGALALLNSQSDSYTPSEIMGVNFGLAGNAVFMQGSHIFHQVTQILSSPVPRITLVNAFMVEDVFDDDWTRFSTFSEIDPKHIIYVEYARHIAHRVQGQLDYLIKKVPFDRLAEEDGKAKREATELAIKVLDHAFETLKKARALLTHTEHDSVGFFDQSTKVVTLIKKD